MSVARTLQLMLAVQGLGGCAAPSYVALLEHGSLAVESAGQMRSIEQAGAGLPLGAGSQYATVGTARLQRDFADALAARPLRPERFVVYLEADGHPSPLSGQVLDQVLHAAHQRDYPVVVVTGHTDSLGHKAVNLQVGLQRAQDIAERLEARGLQARLQIESLGELDLLVKTPDATAQVRNRRVEIEIR